MSRASPVGARWRAIRCYACRRRRIMSALIGSARRFGAPAIIAGRADVLGAAAIARCEESLAEAVEEFFRRRSVARFSAAAVCNHGNERVVTADAASSGLGPPREGFQFGCDQYQPFRL